jgi:hypothetical protein
MLREKEVVIMHMLIAAIVEADGKEEAMTKAARVFEDLVAGVFLTTTVSSMMKVPKRGGAGYHLLLGWRATRGSGFSTGC